MVAELWELRQPEATISFETLAAGLSRLALDALQDTMPVYIPRGYAVEKLQNPALLDPENSAGFLIVDDSNVRFAHFLLLIYFAARGVRERPIQELVTDPVFNGAELRVSKALDPVIILLAGLSNDPAQTVTQIADIDPFLAMECVYGGLPLSAEAVQALARHLLSSPYVKNQQGRVSAVHLLPASTHQTGLPLLLDAMRTGSWHARRAATRLLLKLDITPLPEVETTLARLANDEDASLRWLRQVGEAALPTLLHIVASPESPGLRTGAIRTLGKLNDRAAVPALVEALLDADDRIQAEAQHALTQIQDTRVYLPLVNLMFASQPPVRTVIQETLKALGTDALHNLLDLAQTTSSQDVRTRTIAALKLIGPDYIQTHVERLETGTALEPQPQPDRRSEGTMIQRLITKLDRGLFRGNVRDTTQSDAHETREGSRPTGAEEREAQPLSHHTAQQARDRLKKIVERPQVEQPERTTSQPADTNADNWSQRRDNVLAMGQQPPEIAIPQLTAALTDPDSLVRVAAVQTLSIFSTQDAAMEALFTALGDEEPLVGDTASDVLRAVGRPAIPYLLRALDSENVNVRGVAIEKLGEIGDPSVIDALANRLYDEETPFLSDQRICDLAARALEKIGTRESLHIVLRWKAEKAPDPRTAALLHEVSMEVLNEKETEAAPVVDDHLQRILNNLMDTSSLVQQAAARELKNYAKQLKSTGPETPDYVPISNQIVAASRTGEWTVRWAAAEALGWLSNPGTIPALVELLEDEHWIVRGAAIRALVEMKDTSVVPYITDLLEDPKENVREIAASAIGELGGQSTLAATRLGVALGDNNEFVRLAAIQALGQLGDTTNLDQIITALENGPVNIRWAAAEALLNIAVPESIPALIQALTDESGPYFEERKVCHIAAEALERIGTPETLAVVARWQETQAAVQGG